MEKILRVGLIQPEIFQDNKKNKENLFSLFTEISKQNPQIIILPEKWWHHDLTTLTKDKLIESFHDQYKFLTALVETFPIPLISGGMWNYDELSKKFVISSYYFNKHGQQIAEQRKIHLYGREKTYFSPGKRINIIADQDLSITFSILICFDLTISNTLSRFAVKNGAEIIFNPVAIWEKGLYNWDIYTQARALENRIPIVACNSIFQNEGKKFPGYSKIIQFQSDLASPAQLHIQSLSRNQGILVEDIDISFPNQIREERLAENVSDENLEVRIIRC
jgi:predicted amidohydrolase